MKSSLSEVFKLKKTGYELDFVDLDLLVDLQLYVDPILLYRSSIDEFNEAHSLIVEFFSRAVNFVNQNKSGTAERMCQFPDAENLLGVASQSHAGHGPSNKLGRKIYEELVNNKNIRKNGLTFLNEFQLLIEGISFDLVSDAAVQISKEVFIRYTQEQCKIHKIPIEKVPIDHCFDWPENDWYPKYDYLPRNPLKNGEPFFLTPWTLVRRYPEGNYIQFYNEIYRYVLQARYKSDLWTALGKKPKITFKEIEKKYEKNKPEIVGYVKENPDEIVHFFNKISIPPELFLLERLALHWNANPNQIIYPELLSVVGEILKDKKLQFQLRKTSGQLRHQLKLQSPRKKIIADLQTTVTNTRRSLVLLLGNFTDKNGVARLNEIKSILSRQYAVITLKDVPQLPGESLGRTVVRMSTLARFVIIEDSYPGGQLSEIEHLKSIEVIAPILRETGKKSSYMSQGISTSFSNFKEIDYQLIKGNGIDSKYVNRAVVWAEERLNEIGKKYNSVYPWQRKEK